MQDVIEYSNKATAVRGIERAGVNKEAASDFLFQTEGGKWAFNRADVKEALDLVAMCGRYRCPACNVHLSNGILDNEELAEMHGAREARFLPCRQWMCLGCDAEWGDVITPQAPRVYLNKSTVDGAVAHCHALFDANPSARRKDAIALAVADGVAFYTARTQYQKWFAKRK